MSKPDTWMPLYIGDYIADTMHLNTEQHGAYLLLLMTAWNRGGRLPADEAQLSLICRSDKRSWARIRGAILPFFQTDNGSLIQPRLVAEYEKALRVNAKQKANGAKGGRPRKTKTETQEKPLGFGSDNPNKTPSPSPSQESISDPDGSGGEPPKVTDPVEIIFGYGVPLLTNAGTPEKQARSFLGGMRKQHGDAALIDKLRECFREKPLQPLEWLAAALPPPSAACGKPSRHAGFENIDYRAGISADGRF